ncbi:AAA domain-containing protein [Haloquadratum walsbyi]|uniref:DNA helicase n=1 Tax=Haloquadratum walsbyi J07HQW2 TaxID=1238425 RepID=U1PRZ8_9EURY|nr:AAA domain-containing protein [Haloquadratum walsbyi]ERG95136.1 MAG: superfamily I DNA and RNA helicase [Haloquadratum walsbyi J07HQW2]
MQLRGQIIEIDNEREVTTDQGSRSLVEITLRVDDLPENETDELTISDSSLPDTPIRTLTLWGDWAETATYAEPDMELLVSKIEIDEYHGDIRYSTTSDSYVILEPSFIVDVTDIRSWVQCPRMYYLNKLSGIPLKYPVVKGTIVHEVFGDLLRGRDLASSIDDRVEEVGLELGLLGRDADAVREEVRQNATAIEGWLDQGTLDPSEDTWRSEQTLISPMFGIKGRADALRRGTPVELKTGKNTNRDPRFQDKIQAAAYALILVNRGIDVDTGTLLYTKNTAVDRTEETGDLSPAKDFSIGPGLLKFVVRQRNEIAAMEYDMSIPTGHEADAICEYCFEQDTCRVVAGRLDQESKAGQVGQALPADEREYLEEFYQAIESERRAVHDEYRKLWTQSSAERAADDRALIDLTPAGTTQLDNGRWKLRATRDDDAVSKLRSGDIALGSNGDPITGQSEVCRIRTLDADGDGEGTVVVTADEEITLRRLDVYPSEIGVDRMLTALDDFILRGNKTQKAVFFDRREPTFVDRADETYISNNNAQNRAVRRAVNAEDFALIHGPPGTGKTYTIAQLLSVLVARGERVLLSAFTNRAVDNALTAVRDIDVDVSDKNIVRVGTDSGVDDAMQDVKLDQTGSPETCATAIQSASVVAATTSTCGSRVMREQSFDIAVIDEASQLTEPNTLAAVALADRVVLVGDHQQLPPVVRADTRLQTSLFQRLIDLHPNSSVLLDRQYRMAQRIQAFSSKRFYDGALRPATQTVATQQPTDLLDEPPMSPTIDGGDGYRQQQQLSAHHDSQTEEDTLPAYLRDPVAFIDPEGRRDGNTNVAEADHIADIVTTYINAGVDPSDIGIIAPFRAQVAAISRRTSVTVDTVDRFQGSAKEIVIISFVATNSLEEPIFEDTRRVNVAITRARKGLVLVGDTTALSSDPFYAELLEWANQ